MQMTQEELDAILDEHAKWLRSRHGKNVQGQCADFSHKDLSFANFTGCWLEDVNFACANLSHADFSGADLTDAVLRLADLSFAKLNGACLARAIMVDATLTDADLIDTDLNGANLFNAALNVNSASPLVYDTLLASLAFTIASKKTQNKIAGKRTREEWEHTLMYS